MPARSRHRARRPAEGGRSMKVALNRKQIEEKGMFGRVKGVKHFVGVKIEPTPEEMGVIQQHKMMNRVLLTYDSGIDAVGEMNLAVKNLVEGHGRDFADARLAINYEELLKKWLIEL